MPDMLVQLLKLAPVEPLIEEMRRRGDYSAGDGA